MKSLIELNIAEIVTLTSFYSGIVEIDSIEELFEYEDDDEKDKSKALAMDKLMYKIAEVEYN